MSHYDNYTVGWICALPLEMAASKIMLDKTHDALPPPRNDNNSYIYGEIAQHNIVIACLPSGVYGKVSAANVATQMSRTFRNLQYRFMVGIGAGIPSESADIRLGDVVVSMPTNNSPGVVQYDFGKQFHTGFQRSGTMNKPPQDHLTALSTYRALARINTDPIPRILAETSGKRNEMSGRLVAPSRNHDRLFRADYHHYPQADSCERCDSRMLVSRPKRAETGPFVHYGLIASGDILLKDPRTRDRLRDQEGAICVEMEAAGLMDTFGCLVVRGICDYADSHKNDDWQPYAAVVAAAFTKGLLESIPQSSVEPIPRKNWFEDFARHNPRHARDRIHQQSGGLLRESYEWILENHDYVAWATREQGSLLWIHGNPGTGKTMLLLGIIEELSKTALPGHLVYFFCYSGEVDSSTSILKGMIYSLLFDHPYIRAQVQKRYTHDGSHANSAEIFFFGDIFRFILSMIPRSPTYILIDGLDECGKGIQELKHLIQQTLNQFPYVRWIVSSRNDAEIERLASKVRPMIDISLQPSDAQVSKAVDSYLAWQISELSIPKLTAWSRLRMRMDLERLSEGTYLWAQFACKELRSMTSYEPSRGFNEMPSELTQMYARMMKKISDTLSPEDLSVCTQLLAVMAVIYEPIRVVNLPSVLKFPDLTDDPIDWVEKCSPLLIIRNDKVCLIHESARKFLILSKEDPAYFQSSAHAGLVLQSLSYLSDTLKQDICNLSDPGFSIEGKPFPSHNRLESVKYASLYWVDHLNQACTLSGDGTFHELSDAIDIFLRKFFLFWLESMVLLKSYSKGIHMIKALKDIVQGKNIPSLVALIDDAESFALWSRDLVEVSPLQIYASALAFAPTSSIIKRLYQDDLLTWVGTHNVLHDDWYERPLTLVIAKCVKGSDELVTCVHFAPDGRRLLCGTRGGGIQFWDIEALELLGEYILHTDPVKSIICSQDGKLIASVTDSQIKVISSDDFQIRVTHDERPAMAPNLAISPDNTCVAIACSDLRICIWCAITGTIQAEFLGHDREIDTLEFIPGSRRLLSVCVRHKAVMWDIDTGHQIWSLEDIVRPIRLPGPPRGDQWPICTSTNYRVRIHDPITGDIQWSPDSRAPVCIVLYHPPKVLVCVLSNCLVEVWNPKSRKLVVTIRDRAKPVRFLDRIIEAHSGIISRWEIALSPDSRSLALCCNDGVDIWDCGTGVKKRRVSDWQRGFPRSIRYLDDSLQFLEDDHSVIWKIAPNETRSPPAVSQLSLRCPENTRGATRRENSILITDKKNPETYIWLHGHLSRVHQVTVSGSGDLCASVSEDGDAYLWRIPDHQPESTKRYTPFAANLASAAGRSFFSPCGRWFVTIAGEMRITDLHQQETVLRLRTNNIEDVVFSSDSKWLVFHAPCKYLGIWDSEATKVAWILPFEAGPQEVLHSWSWAWVPSCRIVRCWNDDINRKDDGHSKDVHTLIFSSNSRWLLTSDGETTRVRNTATGKLQSSFQSAILSPLKFATFTSDGNFILSIEGQGSIRLRDVETGDIIWYKQQSTMCRPIFPKSRTTDTPDSPALTEGPPPPKHYALLSSRKPLLALHTGTETIQIRHAETGKLLCDLMFPGQAITDFNFMDEESGDKIAVTLALGNEGEVQIFNAWSGKLVQSSPIYQPASSCQRLACEGRNLWELAVSEDGWISAHGHNLLCLPPELQHVSWAVQDHLLGIHLRLGRAIFFEFRPNNGSQTNGIGRLIHRIFATPIGEA